MGEMPRQPVMIRSASYRVGTSEDLLCGLSNGRQEVYVDYISMCTASKPQDRLLSHVDALIHLRGQFHVVPYRLPVNDGNGINLCSKLFSERTCLLERVVRCFRCVISLQNVLEHDCPRLRLGRSDSAKR